MVTWELSERGAVAMVWLANSWEFEKSLAVLVA